MLKLGMCFSIFIFIYIGLISVFSTCAALSRTPSCVAPFQGSGRPQPIQPERKIPRSDLSSSPRLYLSFNLFSGRFT